MASSESRACCPVCNKYFPMALISDHVNEHYDGAPAAPRPQPQPTPAPVAHNVPPAPAARRQNSAVTYDSNGVPMKRCPMCRAQVPEVMLDDHVGQHIDSGDQMMWQDSSEDSDNKATASGAGALQHGGNPFLPGPTPPPRGAAIVGGGGAGAAAAAAASSDAPPGSWRCPVCSVLLPQELRANHERAHVRRNEVGSAAVLASANPIGMAGGARAASGGGSVAGGGGAGAGNATGMGSPVASGTGGVRVQCPLCSKIIHEIHIDEHMFQHEMQQQRGGGGGGASGGAGSNTGGNVAGGGMAGGRQDSGMTQQQKDDEPREPCIICRKPVRKSLYEWHVQSCGVERTVECCVCVDDVPLSEVFSINCPQSHFTCLDCAQRMCEIAAREGGKARCPGCPAAQPYLLPSTEVLAIFKGDRNNDVYKRYADFELRNATSGGNFFSCRTTGCPNKVFLDDEASRRPTCFRCQLCNQSTCTLCKSQPFHYRLGCREAAAVHTMWIAVLQEMVGRGGHGNSNLVKDLRDKMDRHAELLKDEVWKEEHCRCCAKCGRPIEKMEGCDAMVCGQDAHGGNKQDGCGASNNWAQMQPYKRKIPPPPPANDVKNRVLLSTTTHSEFDRCVSCRELVVGPRFLCACCPMEESMCLACITKYTETRHRNHFFQVIA